MSYSMDMRDEKIPNEIMPAGWHNMEIVKCEEQTSKQGNIMFKITLANSAKPTEGIITYAIAEPGKRWFLKSILTACGCEGGQDGVYEWDINDVEGKIISVNIEHIDETWIDRNGNTHNSLKAKVSEVKKMEV